MAKANNYFREVVQTGDNAQVVLMCLQPGEDIGMETHNENDQILVFVEGEGQAIIGGEEFKITEGDMSYVSKGTEHNFINNGSSVLKLYTIYAPAHHPSDRVHKTKAEAMEDENHAY